MNRNLPPLPRPNTTGTTATTAASSTLCGECHSSDRWLLHYLYTRPAGNYRKLCTSCVLKLHPTSFCPTCFSLHDVTMTSPQQPPSSMGKTLTCLKCSSLSHVTCVPANVPKSPYLCPLCSNPGSKLFDVKKRAKIDVDRDRAVKQPPPAPPQVVDERAARALVAAASIAAASMNRALVVARADVEKKVSGAALARKRAKEAIDYLASLSVPPRGAVAGNKPVGGTGGRAGANNAVKNGNNGGVIGKLNNVGSSGVNPPPDIKNVDRGGIRNGAVPVPVPVSGVSAPQHLQSGSSNNSMKNKIAGDHSNVGGGKVGTGQGTGK